MQEPASPVSIQKQCRTQPTPVLPRVRMRQCGGSWLERSSGVRESSLHASPTGLDGFRGGGAVAHEGSAAPFVPGGVRRYVSRTRPCHPSDIPTAAPCTVPSSSSSPQIPTAWRARGATTEASGRSRRTTRARDEAPSTTPVEHPTPRTSTAAAETAAAAAAAAATRRARKHAAPFPSRRRRRRDTRPARGTTPRGTTHAARSLPF